MDHLFNGVIEANVSAAVAYGFDPTYGSQVNVASFGAISPYPLTNSTWVEYGARIGYRFHERMVVDGFLVGTAGGEVGRTLHGGVGCATSSDRRRPDYFSSSAIIGVHETSSSRSARSASRRL